MAEDSKKSSFVSSLDDKTNPAYWYYHYDERYCGCSREEYMEKMAEQYRRQKKQEQEAVPSDEEKADPEYWDFYYDARYCSPSREGYVGRMVQQNRSRERNRERIQANNGEILVTVRKVAD